jgi:membrane protease YdiL (CAAX protease family)
MATEKTIKPMSIGPSLLYFAIPSLVITLFVYYLWPYLNQTGTPPVIGFAIVMYCPLALMLIASLIAYRAEGNQFSWAILSKRFRLEPMKKADWFWTIGLIIFMFAAYGTLSFTAKWLASIPFFTPPQFLPPVVDPRVPKSVIPSEFMGVPLHGAWWIILGYLGGLLFNIFGEEFWWRGYILPRQELAMGKYTWLIHGFLWTLFHVFWKWNLLMLLPVCLSLSFVASRRKNTWPGIVAHFVINGTGLIPLIMGVVG